MRSRTLTPLFALALAALAAPLLAQQHEAAASGPFAGDVGNALWTLVVFGLVVFVLGKFAWKPILSGLQAREAFIRTSLEEARRDRAEAEARLKQYEERLNSARSEATAIVEESRRDADVVKRRIEAEAHDEAGLIVERAKREITIAKETAVKELYSLSAKLTTDVASRILAREITVADHERLIRESIERLGDKGSN
jgi:F-type H+-transporting ATPase subunit b